MPVGFFMYKRSETQADTAVIRRFMLGGRYRERGLEEKALEHVLKGLKLQGVKKVLITAGAALPGGAVPLPRLSPRRGGRL